LLVDDSQRHRRRYSPLVLDFYRCLMPAGFFAEDFTDIFRIAGGNCCTACTQQERNHRGRRTQRLAEQMFWSGVGKISDCGGFHLSFSTCQRSSLNLTVHSSCVAARVIIFAHRRACLPLLMGIIQSAWLLWLSRSSSVHVFP